MSTFNPIFYYNTISSVAVSPYLANLVAYYPFNANANDFSGRGNNGTVVNAGGLNFTSTGKVGTAVNFSTNFAVNYFQFPDYNDFSFTDGTLDLPFSISCWILVLTYNPSPYRNVILDRRLNVSSAEYGLNILSTGAISFSKFNRGTTTATQTISYTPSPIIPTSTWFNLIITNTGNSSNLTDLKMYVNGVSVGTRSSSGIYLSMSNTTAIARMAQPSWYTDQRDKHRGFLDEFYIWKNRELTAAEALDVYNKGNAGIALI